MNKPISHYDVILIGAGSVGAPAAFYLAKSGLRVLVLDRQPSPGQESNKRAIGGVRATHSDPAKIMLCQRSLEIFSTWQEAYGDDIEWQRGGYAFVAYRSQEEKALKDLLAKQQGYGLDIHWLDSHQLSAVVPGLNPNGLLGGTFSPQDGNASPLLAAQAFYRQALAAGAKFHFKENVIRILTKSGRVAAVETNQAIYSTEMVINAAGAGAHSVAALIGCDLPVKPDAHEAAITEPVAHFLDPMVVDIRPAAGSTNYYFYQHSTGQIVFCITPSPSIWGEQIQETSGFLPMVAARMLEIMPRLKNVRVRRTWRGLYPMTPDGFPIVGYAQEAEGFIQAAGLCGQGFMLGPGLGELLARLCNNQVNGRDLEILSILSPTRQFAGQELLK